jgi:hypothetical protein
VRKGEKKEISGDRGDADLLCFTKRRPERGRSRKHPPEFVNFVKSTLLVYIMQHSHAQHRGGTHGYAERIAPVISSRIEQFSKSARIIDRYRGRISSRIFASFTSLTRYAFGAIYVYLISHVRAGDSDKHIRYFLQNHVSIVEKERERNE